MIQWQQGFLQDIPTTFKHVHKYNTQFTLTIIQFHSACQSSSMVFLKCTFQSCKLWQASPEKHVSKCTPSTPLTDHGQQRLRDTATRCSVSVRPGIWKGEVLCREWRSTSSANSNSCWSACPRLLQHLSQEVALQYWKRSFSNGGSMMQGTWVAVGLKPSGDAPKHPL